MAKYLKHHLRAKRAKQSVTKVYRCDGPFPETADSMLLNLEVVEFFCDQNSKCYKQKILT